MAAKTLYPRATVKRIVKAHANRPLSKNVDVLIFLDYMLFLQDLLNETAIESKRAGNKKGAITAKSIRKVRQMCFNKYRG